MRKTRARKDKAGIETLGYGNCRPQPLRLLSTYGRNSKNKNRKQSFMQLILTPPALHS
jgi:hypothetical protein